MGINWRKRSGSRVVGATGAWWGGYGCTRFLAGPAGLALLLLGNPGLGAAPEEQQRRIEEVVVTAQKRAQSTMDVGLNVTAIGAERLREYRLEQMSELAGLAGNVSIKENAPGILPVVTIRGVGLNDFSATNNPSAGVYVDEVALSSLALLNVDLFDLERIEVLKGPQGTLYGRNSTAGAINIVTARPELDVFDARLAASFGNYRLADLDGFVNVPVNESLALRFSGKLISQDKGFWFNRATESRFGERRLFLGRAQARFQPDAVTDIVLKLEGQRVRSEIGAGEFFGLLPSADAPADLRCPGSPRCTDFFGYSDSSDDPYRGDYSVDPDHDVDQYGVTLRAERDLGGASLTSVTGFLDFERVWGADTDATPLRQIDFIATDAIRQFSQEVRLAGDRGPLEWLVGGFYSIDDVSGRFDGELQDLFNTTSVSTWDQITESAAAFAHGEWAFSEVLSAVMGLRYTWEKRQNDSRTVDLVSACPGSALTGAPCGAAPVPLAQVDDRISDRNWSWKLGLNWKPDDDLLIYGSISQGVKSGGFFSGVATSSLQLQPYDPETLVAYELGAKWWQRGADLQLSASVFHYDYSDVQTFIRDESGGLPIQRLGNVDDATIRGIDLDLVYAPVWLAGFTLSAGLGLLDTELGTFESSAGPVPKGNDLPDAPDLTFVTGLAYETALAGDWRGRIVLDSRYAGDTFKDALNDPIIAAEDFWVWNGRVSFLGGDAWEISAWGKNLFDERYVTQGVNSLPLGVGFRVYGAPRTFGLSAERRF